MKKYRIKQITFKSGRVLFVAQFKEWYGWIGLSSDGETSWYFGETESRESALKRIDKHFNGNTKVKSITFEYINITC